MFTRRQFIWRAAALGATAKLPRARAAQAQAATLDPNTLAAFVDPLPRLAAARATAPGFYRVVMSETACQLHRDLPPTRCWTYGGHMPGPVIEARSGHATTVEWVNSLPARHFLPIDHTVDGAGADLPEVRAVVHLHGARVPAASDGYPEEWYVPGKSQVCHYPNRQEAAPLFYHDHAMGINRFNIYAGLFGLYLLRDAVEEELKLPSGEYEVPLVLCDRWLDPKGQLYYPTSGIPGKPWIPELFGNALLANGKLLPELAVEPRAYRFRLANTANARFFHLSLSNRQPFLQIGSDQGLLAAPVERAAMMLAPAERIDAIVDFSGHAGERILLMNDAMRVMRFHVGGGRGGGRGAARYRPPARLRPVERIPAAAAVKTRTMTLNEYDDLASNPMMMLLDGKYWHDPVSEKPVLDSTEIWSFLNLTDDTHPIHLHLVRFQVLDRQPFDAEQYLFNGTLRTLGPALPPEADEMGWKDTVRANPGAITRIIVRFEGYAGRYLWHCHILEHEAKEMMRPYQVVAVTAALSPEPLDRP